jgi:hypothetical protein
MLFALDPCLADLSNQWLSGLRRIRYPGEPVPYEASPVGAFAGSADKRAMAREEATGDEEALAPEEATAYEWLTGSTTSPRTGHEVLAGYHGAHFSISSGSSSSDDNYGLSYGLSYNLSYDLGVGFFGLGAECGYCCADSYDGPCEAGPPPGPPYYAPRGRMTPGGFANPYGCCGYFGAFCRACGSAPTPGDEDKAGASGGVGVGVGAGACDAHSNGAIAVRVDTHASAPAARAAATTALARKAGKRRQRAARPRAPRTGAMGSSSSRSKPSGVSKAACSTRRRRKVSAAAPALQS